VDICHEIDAGDIRTAAFTLMTAFPYFPAGTIFTVVVDPGVGSARKAIAARVSDKIVVCPNNGVLSWVLKDHPLQEAFELSAREYMLPEISRTFHGRDVFAPVSAHLSNGLSLPKLGPPIEDMAAIHIPEPVPVGRSLQGELVHIDRFGDLISNVTRSRYEDWRKEMPGDTIRVNLGSTEIEGISETYADAPHGHAVALFGSAGLLEIAVNGGDAKACFGASTCAHVRIYSL
jgi:S-adenosylmethionine hydrolase